MTDKPEATEIPERIDHLPNAEHLVNETRVDGTERDVSMLAMVGLLVMILGIGTAAWGATSPGFFDGVSGSGAWMSCEAHGVPPGADIAQPPTECRAEVNGRIVRGSMEEMDHLIARARAAEPVLPAEQKFWAGVVVAILGIVLIAGGFFRARRVRV